MKNWRNNRNFKKYENADGSFTYIIMVDGENVEVNKEIYEAYAKIGYKMENMDALKCDRVLKNVNGKAVRDDHGNVIMLPEREISWDKLVDEDWDFPSSAPSPEDIVVGQIQIEELYFCLDLLNEKERTLVDSLFFEGITVREYAKITGSTKSSVDRQKTKILGKLKKLLNN